MRRTLPNIFLVEMKNIIGELFFMSFFINMWTVASTVHWWVSVGNTDNIMIHLPGVSLHLYKSRDVILLVFPSTEFPFHARERLADSFMHHKDQSIAYVLT